MIRVYHIDYIENIDIENIGMLLLKNINLLSINLKNGAIY